MSRHQDIGIQAWLQELAARVERLEKGDKRVRVNDTRLGDSVLRPNTYTNQIEMRNLKTGESTPLSSTRDIVWSWPGPVTMSDDTDNSPPACVSDTIVANEIVISRVDTNGDLNVAVQFPGFAVRTGIKDGFAVHVRPIHVQLQRNDLIYLTLLCASESVKGVTVTIRFGQPTGLEDNSLDEATGCGY